MPCSAPCSCCSLRAIDATGCDTISATLTERVSVDALLAPSRVLFYVALFAVPLTAVRGFAGFPWSDIGIFASLAVCLLAYVRDMPRVPFTVSLSSALALLATMFLAMDSSDPAQEISVGLRMVFVWYIWAFVALRVLRERRHLIYAGTAFVLGSVLSSLVALGQFGGVDLRPVFFAETSTAAARFIGLSGHPNGQGGALAVAATLCLGAILYRISIVWASAALAIVLLGLMLCASISGTIATGLGFLILVVRAGRFRLLVGAAATLGGAVLGFRFLKDAFPNLITPFDRFDSAIGIGGVSTVDARANTVEYAWAQIGLHPLSGVGFSGGGVTYDGATATHNMLLLAWYQGGFLMFAGVALMTAYAIFTGLQRTGDGLMEATFAASVAVLFFAQTGPSLYDRYVWLPVILLITAQAQRYAQTHPFPDAVTESLPHYAGLRPSR